MVVAKERDDLGVFATEGNKTLNDDGEAWL